MRVIFILILVCGFGLAGSAAYMIMQRFNQYEAQLAEQRRNLAPAIELVEVAVAAEALEFGHNLKLEDVRMATWPADAVPLGAFVTMEEIMGLEGEDPRAILRNIGKDEPIILGKVSEFGEDAGIRSRLSTGMRAFTIRVDVTTGVSGFLQPNDKVDIYWTGGNNLGTITKLLLEGVRLIAIDQNVNEDAQRPQIAKTVTVEVSPQVVAQLTQAQQSGRLSLSLRGVEDSTVSGIVEVNQSDISGNEVIVIEETRECFTTTRKGTEVIQTPAPCPD